MKQQKSTNTAGNENKAMFGKINDKQSSWSNAWYAVWEGKPETRTNGKNAPGKKNPPVQDPSW